MNNDGWDEFVVPNGFLTGSDARDLASFFWRCVVNASPLEEPATSAYQNAWAGITRLTQVRGYCWNGHERHYAYLGSPEGRFADLSRLSGLGLDDDGRAALRTDWDGDGRQDLTLKNRTAPVLRFMPKPATTAKPREGQERRTRRPPTQSKQTHCRRHDTQPLSRPPPQPAKKNVFITPKSDWAKSFSVLKPLLDPF